MCFVRVEKGHKIDIVVTRYTSKTADVCIPLRNNEVPIDKIFSSFKEKCVNIELKVVSQNQM